MSGFSENRVMSSSQKNLSEAVGKFNQLQTDLQNVVNARRQLESQLTENTVVKEVGHFHPFVGAHGNFGFAFSTGIGPSGCRG